MAWLVLAAAGAPVLASALNGIALFGFRKRWLHTRLEDVRWIYARRIMNIGFLFFVLQAASAIAYSSDNLILAHLIGPLAVAEFTVVYQLFSVGPTLLSMFLIPLWPAYGEAIVRGDGEWIRKTFRRSIAVGLLFNVPYSVLLMLFGNRVIHLWVGDQVSASSVVLSAFGIWTMMNSFNGANAMFLNGANAMKFQASCATLMACANLALSIVLTRIIGLSGVIWGSIISQTIFVLLPGSVYISRHMRRFVPSAADGERFETRVLDQ